MNVKVHNYTIGEQVPVLGKYSWKHAFKDFPNLFIQSETSASTPKYSESNHASKYVMLLSNFRDKDHELSPIIEAGFCHQLVLVP